MVVDKSESRFRHSSWTGVNHHAGVVVFCVDDGGNFRHYTAKSQHDTHGNLTEKYHVSDWSQTVYGRFDPKTGIMTLIGQRPNATWERFLARKFPQVAEIVYFGY